MPHPAALVLLTMTLAVGAAYIVWLLTARKPAELRPSSSERAVPSVTVIVPVLDEAVLIRSKIANLDNLIDATGRLRILVVDGGSTDGTIDLIVPLLKTRPHVELVRTDFRNKTAQLNAALRLCPRDSWVLVTDADARLQPDTLARLLASVEPDVGVVGVPVQPVSAHGLEQLHWRVADWLRLKESSRGTASIVTGPCYFFRRALVDELPPDTIADDAYVAYAAMRESLRVVFVPSVAVELRSPRTVAALLSHKFRKADACLREIFRFLPIAHEFQPPARTVFLMRALMHTVMPLIAVGAGVYLLSLVAFSPHLMVMGGAAAAGMAVSRMLRAGVMFVVLCGLLALVSAAALVAYPFSTQTACLKKVCGSSEYPSLEV